MPNLRKNSIEAHRHIFSSRLKFSNESHPFKGLMSSILPKHSLSRIKSIRFFGKPQSPNHNQAHSLDEDSFVVPLHRNTSTAEIKPFDDTTPAPRFEHLPPIRPKRLESSQMLPLENLKSQIPEVPILVESFGDTSRSPNSLQDSRTKQIAEQKFIDCFRTIEKKEQKEVILLLNKLAMYHMRAEIAQSSD